MNTEKNRWSYHRVGNGHFLHMMYLKMRETRTHEQMMSPKVISEVVRIRLQNSSEKCNNPKNIKEWKNWVKEVFSQYEGIEVEKFDDYVRREEIPMRIIKKLTPKKTRGL